MKLVITDRNINEMFKVQPDIISVYQVKKHDMIVLEDNNEDRIGLLTSNGESWFITDMFDARNHYPGSFSGTIAGTLNHFNGGYHKIWKFDSKHEFVNWLYEKSKNFPNRDKKGRFTKRT